MSAIRVARMNDIESVVAIVRDATRHMETRGIPQWDEVYPSRAILLADIENQHMYLIEDSGAVAGLITLNDTASPQYRDVSWVYPGKILVVHRLTIDPKHQGKKLASRLMDFAERDAASKGCDAIRLDAFTKNPIAIALYERRGYRRAGTVHFRKGPFFCYEKPIGPPTKALESVAADASQQRR
jgi:ribosomal protein S18 acetylase RimI-like enzyme